MLSLDFVKFFRHFFPNLALLDSFLPHAIIHTMTNPEILSELPSQLHSALNMFTDVIRAFQVGGPGEYPCRFVFGLTLPAGFWALSKIYNHRQTLDSGMAEVEMLG